MKKMLVGILLVALVATPLASAEPLAKATADRKSVKAGEEVSFSAAASTADGGARIVSYDWSFGDGTTARGVRVSKTFSTNGVFSVVLTIVDSKGARATDAVNVTVLAPAAQGPIIAHEPVAAATPGAPLVVTMTLGGSPARGAEVAYKAGELAASVAAKKGDGDTWSATIPANAVKPGLTYSIAATGTNGLASRAPPKAPDAYTVTVEPASPSPPAPSPIVPASPSPGGAREANDAPAATDEGKDSPGFGLAAALAALGAAWGVRRRR